jgi:hypothetical protein
MSPSIFAGLPNDLIINIIKINTTTMNAEKQKIKNKFKSCMDKIENVPFQYGLYPYPEYHKSKPIYHRVASEYWNSFQYQIETDEDTDEDDIDVYELDSDTDTDEN